MIPGLGGFLSLLSILVEIKDFGTLKYFIVQRLKGEQVPQSRTTILYLNVISIGDSSFYGILWRVRRAIHNLAAFL